MDFCVKCLKIVIMTTNKKNSTGINCNKCQKEIQFNEQVFSYFIKDKEVIDCKSCYLAVNFVCHFCQKSFALSEVEYLPFTKIEVCLPCLEKNEEEVFKRWHGGMTKKEWQAKQLITEIEEKMKEKKEAEEFTRAIQNACPQCQEIFGNHSYYCPRKQTNTNKG